MSHPENEPRDGICQNEIEALRRFVGFWQSNACMAKLLKLARGVTWNGAPEQPLLDACKAYVEGHGNGMDGFAVSLMRTASLIAICESVVEKVLRAR
jgi:hypothetical protein